MSTRLYLPNIKTDITPAYSLDWTKTTDAARYLATKIRQATAFTTLTTACNATVGTALLAQFISEPLTAQNISGTVLGQIRAIESSTSADACRSIIIWVAKRDGTYRATLLSHIPSALTNEFGSSLANRYFPPSATAINSVDVEAGDRLVIEIGYKNFYGYTGYNAGLSIGDNGATITAAGACSAALAGLGGGNLSNGNYYYKVCFYNARGETEAGTVSNLVTVTDKDTNGQIALSSIPLGGTGTTGRNLYRTVAGGSDFKFLYQITNNTATTYNDNIADGSLTTLAPVYNTTGDLPANETETGDYNGFIEFSDDITFDNALAVPYVAAQVEFEPTPNLLVYQVSVQVEVEEGDAEVTPDVDIDADGSWSLEGDEYSTTVEEAEIVSPLGDADLGLPSSSVVEFVDDTIYELSPSSDCMLEGASLIEIREIDEYGIDILPTAEMRLSSPGLIEFQLQVDYIVSITPTAEMRLEGGALPELIDPTVLENLVEIVSDGCLMVEAPFQSYIPEEAFAVVADGNLALQGQLKSYLCYIDLLEGVVAGTGLLQLEAPYTTYEFIEPEEVVFEVVSSSLLVMEAAVIPLYEIYEPGAGVDEIILVATGILGLEAPALPPTDTALELISSAYLAIEAPYYTTEILIPTDVVVEQVYTGLLSLDAGLIRLYEIIEPGLGVDEVILVATGLLGIEAPLVPPADTALEVVATGLLAIEAPYSTTEIITPTEAVYEQAYTGLLSLDTGLIRLYEIIDPEADLDLVELTGAGLLQVEAPYNTTSLIEPASQDIMEILGQGLLGLEKAGVVGGEEEGELYECATSRTNLGLQGGSIVLMTEAIILSVEASGILVIEGSLPEAVLMEVWALNGSDWQASIYSGFEFTGFAVGEGEVLATKADGLYWLGGDDDNGEPIHTGIRLGPWNFGTNKPKRLRSVCLSATNDEAAVAIKGLCTEVEGEAEQVFDKYYLGCSLLDRSWYIDLRDFDKLEQVEIVYFTYD